MFSVQPRTYPGIACYFFGNLEKDDNRVRSRGKKDSGKSTAVKTGEDCGVRSRYQRIKDRCQRVCLSVYGHKRPRNKKKKFVFTGNTHK